jgi:hypothetical protein
MTRTGTVICLRSSVKSVWEKATGVQVGETTAADDQRGSRACAVRVPQPPKATLLGACVRIVAETSRAAARLSLPVPSNTVGAAEARRRSEVSAQMPKIDFENIPAPAESILVTHFLIVREVARSRAFYADVPGGEVVIEENP